MNYVGIDYHNKYSHVTAINHEGKVIRSNRLENKPEVFREFFKRMEGRSEAVLEASRTWGVMYDLLAELDGVELVKLAHPQKVRAIAEAKIKTDKIDSHILAQLLRADLIPAAYIPGKRARSYKEMLRQRVFQDADTILEPHSRSFGSSSYSISLSNRYLRQKGDHLSEEVESSWG